MTGIELDRLRAETPGVEQVTHFNNAGSSLMPAAVLDAQKLYLDLEARIGGYEAYDQEQININRVYDAVAELLRCCREEVAIVENATVAWDMAFYSLPLGPGDRILTAQSEYGANFVAYLHAARRTGAVIEVIPNDESGATSPQALESMLDDRVKLISVSHVPTNGGLVNPAAEIGAIANKHGITFLLDACQSAGQLDLDVNELGCDLLSATGRKYLRGPRGTGFLYVKHSILDTLDPPMIDHLAADWVAADEYRLRADARRFENWESNYAAKVGLAVAVDYALDVGLAPIEARVVELAASLRRVLEEIPGVTVHDLGERRCGIVTFSVEGHQATAVKSVLQARRINVSVSDPASTLIDSTHRALPDMVRASVHYFNSDAEVNAFAAVIAGLTR